MSIKIINPQTDYINTSSEIDNPIKKELTIYKDYVNTAPFGKWIDKEIILDLLNKIPKNKTRDLVLFNYLWRTGNRITEALSIKKKNIDIDNDQIEIVWLKRRKKQTRYIPLHPTLKQLLQIYTARMNAEDRVFSISRQRADILAKKYGIGHCHIIRHSYAVNFVKQNKNPRAIEYLQKLLGHSHIQTTMQYLHVAPDELKAAIKEINFD